MPKPSGRTRRPANHASQKKKRDPPTCFFSYNGATGSKDYPACLSDGRARALAMCLPSRPLRAASLTLPSTSLTGAASPPLAGAAAAAPLPVCRPDTLAGEAFTMVAIVVVWGEGRVDASRGEQAVVGRCPGAGRRARQARERSVRVLRRAATSNQFVRVFGVSRGRGGGVRTGEDGEQMTALSRCSLSFLRARAAPPPPGGRPAPPLKLGLPGTSSPCTPSCNRRLRLDLCQRDDARTRFLFRIRWPPGPGQRPPPYVFIHGRRPPSLSLPHTASCISFAPPP